MCRSMDGPRISGTKLSKLKRERQTPHDITYMWNLKYDANELYLWSRNKLMDIEKTLVVAKGGNRIVMGWEFDISMQISMYRMDKEQGATV